jgi:hypothetical protein
MVGGWGCGDQVLLESSYGRECIMCRMDLPEPTTSVGTRTDYLVGP